MMYSPSRNYHIVIQTRSKVLKLYQGSQLVGTYPIAVGKKETPTPHGQYYIANKALDPGGVFGSRWLGLSIPKYGIHGTNNPASIGKEVSLGCIRMHNHDVERIFRLVEVGTPVSINP